MDEQEQKNKSSSFEKQQLAKGKDKIKDQAKKKITRKIIINVVIHFIWPVLLPILVTWIAVIFLAGFLDIDLSGSAEDASDAKAAAVSLSLSDEEQDSETVKAKVKMNDDGSYSISTDYDSKGINKIRSEINKTGADSSYFSDYEIGIIGALMENGLDVQDFSKEELKCLPLFIKSEACTQYLDLRPNSEKIVNGEYVPQKIKDLAENEIPGVILVQRTNTNSDSPSTLEYKKESEFNGLVESGNKDATNYFTINSKGNLIVAKWDHTVVTVNGTYPENLDDSEKENPKDEYIITTEEIAYSEYIKKYTMPFDFLVQLLLITEEPEFCTELVDQVLDSKIIINIQEEETITETNETRNYTVHDKDEKYIDYEVIAKGANQSAEVDKQSNYLLKHTKDDEQNDCTNYSTTYPVVKINTVNTNHSYVFEIIESDTWIAHYTKTYQEQEAKINTTKNDAETKGKYDLLNEETSQSPESDSDVQKFISETDSNYQAKIIVPEVTVTTNTNDEDNKYKDVTVKGIVDSIIDMSTNTTPTYHYTEIKDSEGKGTGKYGIPYIMIDSSPVAATETTKEIPSISYIAQPLPFEEGYLIFPSNVASNIIKSTVSKLNIKYYEKIDVNTHKETTVTKYPSDPNPTTNTHIYAKDDKTGEFEKFLLVYDKYPYTRDMMDSVSSWLFDMMEKNENTIELVDIVKYLLYRYSGKDYGVTKLEDFETIFNPEEFTTYTIGTTGNLVEKIKNFLLLVEGAPKNDNGTKYVIYSDIYGNLTVGIGIAIDAGGYRSAFQAAGYKCVEGEEVEIDFVDALTEDTIEAKIEYVKTVTSGLNLTDYQIGALVSRCYQMGNAGALYTSKYSSSVSCNFVDAYKKWWSDDKTEEYYGNKDISGLYNLDMYQNYMKYYTDVETRRQREWLLFATGYDSSTGEYWSNSASGNSVQIDGIDLYNSDGSVNTISISTLQNKLTTTAISIGNYRNLSHNQCTWWAAIRADQYLNKYGTKYKQYPTHADSRGEFGNGGVWYDKNKDYGWFEYGSEPRANSIVSWKGGGYGHVAYVEAVDYVNGKIYISHASSGEKFNGIQAISIDGFIWSGYTLNGYIYLDSPK